MNRTTKKFPEIPEVCPHCYFGRIQPGKRSFAARTNGKPVMVPDFPAWICDVCGKREYDLDALNNLALLLSPMPRKLIGIKPARSLRKGSSEQPGAHPPAES